MVDGVVSQIFGGTGGGACSRCGQYGANCHCLDDAQKFADALKEDAAKPPCKHCGKTWWQHTTVDGIGYVCPQAVFTYEPSSK